MKSIAPAFIKLTLLISLGIFLKEVPNRIPADWLTHPLSALYYFFLYLFVLDLFYQIIKVLYRRRKKLSHTTNDNFLNGLTNIRRVLTGLGFLFVPFSILGLDIKTVFTSLSIVAAAIAIISKDFIVDIVVGFYFSFSDHLEIGDYIKLNDKRGKIAEIGLLKLKVINDDDDVVFIPNNHAFTQEITNYSKGDTNQVSIDFEIDIDSIYNLEVLEQELIQSLEIYAAYIEPSSYQLRIESLKKDMLELKFKYKLNVPDALIYKKVRRSTIRHIFSYITKLRMPPAVGKEQ